MRILQMAMTLALVTVSACDNKPAPEQAPAPGTTGMMGGTPRAIPATQAMSLMGAQLDSLGSMTPAQMAAMMPAHGALASQMMSAMGAGMQGMNMEGGPGWAALGDSVRQDLTTMAGLSEAALQAHMQSHIGRMRRMMTMYRGMPHR